MMKIYQFEVKSFPKINEKIALCLGFFDGVHIGHQKLILEAKKTGHKIGVLTFDNSVYNFKNSKIDLITPYYSKISILESLGVDYYFELIMNNELLDTSNEVFIKRLYNLNPAECICGSDYTFGKDKAGNPFELSKHFDTKILPLENYNNTKISSRVIHDEICNGNFEFVTKVLGRNYRVSGIVVEGYKNGSKINYPTANILFNENFVKPKEGVYIGKVEIDGKKYRSIASFGTHPTINSLNSPILEAHILDYNDILYGKTINFDFIKFVRNNVKFDNLDDLKFQLEKDKRIAIEFFKKESF